MSNTRILRYTLLFAFLFVALLLPSAPASAQCDDGLCGWKSCGTPAFPVPFGDQIEPAGAISADRDSTGYDPSPGSGSPYQPLFMDLDIANGWIFTGHTQGMQIWDARTNPANPSLVRTVVGANFAGWITDPHEGTPVRAIAVAPGKDDLVGVAVSSGGGLSVFDTEVKEASPVRYGDIGKTLYDLYAGTIGGIDYLFAGYPGNGLRVYSLSKVRAMRTAGQSCVEDTNKSTTCGPYLGRIGTRSNVTRVAGVGDATGTKHWVAVASGGSATGFDVLDVSNPTSAKLKITSNDPIFVYALEMWRNGSKIYLALRGEGSGNHVSRIYDVSCLASGGACSLGSPIWSTTMPADTGEQFITHSTTGGRHFLYFGNFNKCAIGPQNEWLYDVSTPSQPFDITPAPQLVGGQQTGYWGWYYRRNTGFNFVAGRVGRFYGQYFYRAAYSIFDVHMLAGGVPPTPDFSWTGEADGNVYQGTSVAFQDLSTGAPDSWSWIFPGGTPATSSAENPSGVTFGTTGTKAVELTACNGAGCSDPKTRNLAVLDAAPALTAVTASPNPALQCQTVTFGASGGTGKPPLTYAFELRDPSDTAVVKSQTGTQATMTWSTGAATQAGLYPVDLTLTNGSGSATKSSSVTIQSLPSLAFTNGPSNDAFTNNVVQFHVQTQGATEWRWDFGDGTTTGWVSDATTGQNPSHTYTQAAVDSVCGGSLPCTFDVTVEIRNCAANAITSPVLSVVVESLEPLVARFEAQGCSAFGCDFLKNQSISFADSSSGSPDTYDYDWDGDGTYEQAGRPTPATSHTYATTGGFRPKLRVHRGAETATYTHSLIIVGETNPPSISLSVSRTSAKVGETISFTATASNCSPSSSGWSWGTSGGQTVGQSGSSITLKWGTKGTKTVTVANSSCGSAQASRSVTITEDSGGTGTGACGPVGGGGLQACIQSSVSGKTVSLDGTGSTGSPTGYQWSFGDGKEGTGGVTNHTYAKDGTYTVTLEVAKAGECAFGVCTASKSIQVVISTGSGGGVGNCGPEGGDGLQACIQRTVSGKKVSLDGTGSAGSPTDYRWDFGDGETGSGGKPNHTYASDGTYQVSLEVAKPGACEGGECTASHSIDVVISTGGNGTCGSVVEGSLQACFDYDPAAPGAGQTIHFDGTPSKGNPVSYAWSFEGAGTATGSGVTKAFAQTGTYDVTLTVEAIVPGSKCQLELCSASVTRTVEVFGEPPKCVDSETTICLNDGRFRVEAEWWDGKGNAGDAKVVRLTEDTAYFWFFSKKNVELVVKVLDGSKVNGQYWVFYGALTNVGFEITVTDTETENSKLYHNDPGEFASVGDTKALPSTAPSGGGARTAGATQRTVTPFVDTVHDETACVQTETRLCLQDRWALDVVFKDPEVEEAQEGHARTLTSDTGYFWFFGDTNVELVVKVLDGRKVNGQYWVFYGSLSNVEFDLVVTDLHTGAQKTYHNEPGTFASFGDTKALPGE